MSGSQTPDARQRHLIQARLMAAPLPVFAQLRRPRAEMMADDRRQMAAMLGGPLLGEHHVVVGGCAERIRIGLLLPRVPELKEADGDVTAEGIDVARRQRPMMLRRNEGAMRVLWIAGAAGTQFLDADHV